MAHANDRVIPASPDDAYAKDATAQELQIAIDHSMTGISWLDAQGRFVKVRAGYSRMLGYGLGELDGQSWTVTVPPEDRAAGVAAFKKMLSTGRAELETRGRRKDGSIFDKQLLLVKTTSRDGQHSGHYCFMRDISERKRAEAVLHQARVFSDRLIDVIQDGVSVIDAQGRHIKVNDAFVKMTGFSKEELVGQGVPHPYWPEEHADAITRAIESQPHGAAQHELIFCRKDGKRFPVIVSPSTTTDGAGNTIHIATIKDISDRKEAERRLADAERLKSMGTLAGGIAHDLNNLLTPVIGYADALQKGMLDVDEAAAAILCASQSARELIGQILEFARKDGDSMEPVSLTEATRDALQFSLGSLPANVLVETSFEAIRDTVNGTQARFQQVVMNLISNAGHAMRDNGGTLGVRLTNPTNTDIELEVSDTGTGIEASKLERIFEPFFTTKAVGEGTGLGLATVHGVVNEAGGDIRVESVIGAGSRFVVRLPLCRKTAVMDSPQADTARNNGMSLHIMLVDDQPQVLKIGAALLAHLGHTVESFQNPKDALAKGVGGFDLILTDFRMEGFTGVEFAQRLGDIDTPIILMTGDGQDIGSMPPSIVCRLNKPFLLRDLSDAIRTALQKGRESMRA